MSSRKDSKDPSLRALVADPWRKLISLVLGAGLWFFLDAQVTKEDVLTLRLEAVDRAEPLGEAGNVLALRMALRNYTVEGFEDMAGNPVRDVVLRFRGPSHLISRLAENPSFSVSPTEQELEAVRGSYVFDRGEVRARNELFQDLLNGMEPPQVRVQLERNDSREVRLTKNNVAINPPPPSQDPDFMDRVQQDRARFFPETVRLRGTRSSLASVSVEGELFEANLAAYANTRRLEVRVELELLDSLARAGVRVEPRLIEVTYPLRPQYRQFELRVPVMLSLEGTRFDVAQWQAPEDQKATLFAAGPLEAELSNKDENELREWARRNALVIARLPETADVDDSQTARTWFVLLNDAWKEGRDYRVELLPLVVNPKEPR